MASYNLTKQQRDHTMIEALDQARLSLSGLNIDPSTKAMLLAEIAQAMANVASAEILCDQIASVVKHPEALA